MAKFTLSIALSVLDDLGINLYSNVPAVLSEVVANAWDADATEVSIDIDSNANIITIKDNGCGMGSEDIQNKYLNVGYKRRQNGETETGVYHRPVMGRKGIGKLALFSIATNVEVMTSRKLDDGSIEKNTLTMSSDDIRQHIKEKPGIPYEPTVITDKLLANDHGTQITLTNLKKGMGRLEGDLKRRLARRFSVIDGSNNFDVILNGEKITPDDRNYYNSVQYVWLIGDEGKEMRDLFTNASKIEEVDGVVDSTKGYAISGWIGTFREQKAISEGDNTIAIIARGKLIHEDILKNLKEGGVFTKYLIGDVRADFVDLDEEADLATSDRQSLKEDDERFIALKEYIQGNILKDIQRKWTEWRREAASESALENEKVKEWYNNLEGKDLKKAAKKLFGVLGSLGIEEDEDKKKDIYRLGIVAFERLAHERALSEIDNINDEKDFLALRGLFSTLDDIEAGMYYSIAKSRVGVLQKLKGLVDADAKERVLQEHIFNHLWLLNPSWERATENARIEEKVTTEFNKVTAKLSDEEKKGRIDIRYRSSGGAHIIVELKKYSVSVDVHTLGQQVAKYVSALKKCLRDQFGEDNPNVQVVCILGKPPTHSSGDINKIKGILNEEDARYITYDQLIADALESYQGYLDASEKSGRIQKILAEL